jgi:hypothetical protein
MPFSRAVSRRASAIKKFNSGATPAGGRVQAAGRKKLPQREIFLLGVEIFKTKQLFCERRM